MPVMLNSYGIISNDKKLTYIALSDVVHSIIGRPTVEMAQTYGAFGTVGPYSWMCWI